MKDKLEVGMYVRSKDGEIHKCLNIYIDNNNSKLNRFMNQWGNMIMFDEIEGNPSYTWLDLIEVGDIIKFDITDTDNYAEIQGYNCWEISCEEELNGLKEMIEMESAKLLSIVTKEQFKAMEYKIEEYIDGKKE